MPVPGERRPEKATGDLGGKLAGTALFGVALTTGGMCRSDEPWPFV